MPSSPPAAGANKRMALSRDQRSVLEAVYAMEKLPDAPLRERLSRYLELSVRQIQVWFQNRRQREKTGNTASPKRAVLNKPTEIMDALFEFSGKLGDHSSEENIDTRHVDANAAVVMVQPSNFDQYRTDSGSDLGEGPPSNRGSPLLHATSSNSGSFQWDAPKIVPIVGAPIVETAACSQEITMGMSACANDMSASSSTLPTTTSNECVDHPSYGACVHASLPSEILNAVLGFACHELCLDAIELWPLPIAGMPQHEPVFTHQTMPHTAQLSHELACCRAMLAPRLCESVASSSELAWYGISAQQKEALARTGVSFRTLVAVPCSEPPSGSSASTSVQPPAVCGVLVMYTRQMLPQTETFGMLLHSIGSTAAAAYALGINAAGPPVDTRSRQYMSLPAEAPTTGISWLLLAAARALQSDVAEHWIAQQRPPARGSGIDMTLNQMFISERMNDSPDLVRAVGVGAETHHPFSSQMSRASLYAGKLVWYNRSGSDETLDCIKAQMQTAISIPLNTQMGSGSTFVLYAMHRMEQSRLATFFLTQLQVLASASLPAFPQAAIVGELNGQAMAAVPQAAILGELNGQAMATIETRNRPSSQQQRAIAQTPGTQCNPSMQGGSPILPSSSSLNEFDPEQSLNATTSVPLPTMPDSRKLTIEWSAQESVMSTDQVISLIEGIGDASSRCLSRNGSLASLPPLEAAGSIDDEGIALANC